MTASRDEVYTWQDRASRSTNLPWRRALKDFIGYGWASLAALIADAALLKTLVDFFHWHYRPASVVAFTLGVVISYILSICFVFSSSRLGSRLLEFCLFAALGLVGLLVNTLVLSLCIETLSAGLLTAKCISAGCTFLTNFVLRRQLLFTA